MSRKLKSAIQWFLFVLVVLVAIITLFSLIMVMIAPAFFKDLDISGFSNYITISNIILAFLSVGLGFFSIWQASKSNKETEKILNKIQIVQQQQEILNNRINLLTFDTSFVSAKSKPENWVPDDVTE